MTNKEAMHTIKCNYPSSGIFERLCEALDIAIECIEKCERNCLNCKNYTIYELGYYCEERDIYVYPDMRCDEDWVARF